MVNHCSLRQAGAVPAKRFFLLSRAEERIIETHGVESTSMEEQRLKLTHSRSNSHRAANSGPSLGVSHGHSSDRSVREADREAPLSNGWSLGRPAGFPARSLIIDACPPLLCRFPYRGKCSRGIENPHRSCAMFSRRAPRPVSTQFNKSRADDETKNGAGDELPIRRGQRQV